MNVHRRRFNKCPWKNVVAVAMATVTAGIWIPFAANVDPGGQDDEEEFDWASPAPAVGAHDIVPTAATGKVVDLTKPPKTVPTTKPVVAPVKKTPKPTPTHTQPTPKQTVTPPPVATTRASRIIAFLRAQLGDRYVYGGTGPNAWDCSGLSQHALGLAGVDLPRTSEAQSLRGVRVSMNELRVGDLLFWGIGPGLAYHVTVYIGNGMFIGAQNPSTGVVERSLAYDPPDFARRVL